MKITRRALLLGGLGALAAASVPVGETYRFEVNRHAPELAGLRAPIRISLLTDLHYGPYVRAASVRAWVDATLRERPDLVIIAGDFIDADVDGGTDPLLHELARLHAPLGVYGTWGNHDYYSFGRVARLARPARPDWEARRERFRRDLHEAGVRVLLNENVRVREDLVLAGVDDFETGDPGLALALHGPDRAAATLLVSHNPDLLPLVPATVGLTLCGHTHGGQIRLPVVGALSTSSRYGERFAMGFVRAPARGFVSRGLGVTGVPMRLNCPPELVTLDLRPAGSQRKGNDT
ncbi:metallophosphoesterase [Deinococcus pimensis]|uniref:metallophosphoesterase n=1 Tax=Deinococcus pimensis TaxID=309888 RepID=UPI0004AE3761|nr:metallophosphoesterase [Deinococcus pimensis]